MVLLPPAAFTPFAGTPLPPSTDPGTAQNRAGYEVIRIPMHNGRAEGGYEDFLTGFVTPDGKVWGRPVGVTIARDGSLFVTDDGSRSVWHVTYEGKPGNQNRFNR